MERIQHCEATTASQSNLKARIIALRDKFELFDRQTSKLQLDRSTEDLERSASYQREDEQIVKKRKVEDEQRIASRKPRYEQIVKKRKVEDEKRIASRKCRHEQMVNKRKVMDEGQERSRASLGAETAVSWKRHSTAEI